MSTDRLTDSLDRQWVPGTVLGRGTWGRSRIVRDPQGRDAVLKEPLVESDFPADAPLPEEVLAACRTAARQQAELLSEGSEPYLPRLEATVDLGGGRIGLILPRYHTLQRKLGRGVALGDVVALVHRVANTLAEAGRVHGNLRPSNIVFGERDQPFLADVSTPAVSPHQVRLADLANVRHWLPPEARNRATVRQDAWAMHDTWALCQILHAAVLTEPGTDERPATLVLAEGGLDKVALATLKDAALAKLAAEGTNPRFRGRVTDRLGALLSRGLSASWEPSPPYRFSTARDLAERLAEILALLHPRGVAVGRLLLPASAADGVFQGGGELSFSVTVGCTQGISDHEDIVCGLQLVDLDATDDPRRPVEDTKIVVQVHPSGRLRFHLSLPAVPPGRYRVRVAFAVKDSGHEPQVASGEFEVRPPPGYVPPRLEPERAALPFPGGSRPTAPEAATPAPRAERTDAAARPQDRARPSSVEPPPDGPHLMPLDDPSSAAEAPSRPSQASQAAETPRGSQPGRRTASDATGSFPRPVAPPADEEEPVVERPARRTPAAASERSRRALQRDLTDATVPEPGVWPPPASPRTDAIGPTGRTDPRLSVEEPLGLPVDTAQPVTFPPEPLRPLGSPPPSMPSSPSDPGYAASLDAPPVVHQAVRPLLDEETPVAAPPPHFYKPPPPVAPMSTRPRAQPAQSRGEPRTASPPRIERVRGGDLPERTEDLPEVARTRPTEPWFGATSVVGRVVDAIRRDSYVAVGAAVAASLVLVLLTSALLKAC
ncbi:MAG: hypothetical protein R3F59_26590 [Myxococcota bacterium]